MKYDCCFLTSHLLFLPVYSRCLRRRAFEPECHLTWGGVTVCDLWSLCGSRRSSANHKPSSIHCRTLKLYHISFSQFITFLFERQRNRRNPEYWYLTCDSRKVYSSFDLIWNDLFIKKTKDQMRRQAAAAGCRLLLHHLHHHVVNHTNWNYSFMFQRQIDVDSGSCTINQFFILF